MNKYIISIILPFYNVEKYIENCLDSIYSQKINEDHFEVICIDDCSPDNSRLIVERYANKHSNISLIVHKLNKCLGGARNTGLLAAKGDFIWFVDSDDIIASNSLEIIFSNINEHSNIDILQFNYSLIDHNSELIRETNVFKNNFVEQSGVNFIRQNWGDEFVYHLGYVWRNIYKKDFLLKNNLLFPENVFWEDTVFMPKALLLAEKVISVENNLYLYRVNPDSVSGSFKKNIETKLLFQYAFITSNQLFDFSTEIKGNYEDIASLLEKKSNEILNSFLIFILKSEIKQQLNFYNLLPSYKNTLKVVKDRLTLLNKLILHNKILGLFTIFILTLIYRIKHKL